MKELPSGFLAGPLSASAYRVAMVKASASGGKAQAIHTWWSHLSFTIGIKEEKGFMKMIF